MPTADLTLDPADFGPGQPCFGCGPDHPIGFHLRFTRDGDSILCRFTPDDRYQGPPGIMHGGLVTTLADEVAAWAVIGLLGKFGFTAAMQVKLLRPVRIGVEIEAQSRITRATPRTARVDVRLRQAGADAVAGELTFALLGQAAAERMLGGPLPEAWQRYCR